MKRFIGLLAILLSGACASLPHPDPIVARTFPHAASMELDAVHREAYARALACLGGRKPALEFDDIDFQVAPGLVIHRRDENGHPLNVEGFYDAPTHTVWVVEAKAKYLWANEHEILHALLGEPGHPWQFFDKCHLMNYQNE